MAPRCLLALFIAAVVLRCAASTGVGLTLINDTLRCIINSTTPGTEGNVYGFEDGSVRLVDGAFHMLVSEEYASPKWVGMRLAHWVTAAPLGDTGWSRVGTLVLDGREMISTENCSDPYAHTGALWSPVAFYDDDASTWCMTYVGYDCPGNIDGVIQLARSTVPGPAGIGGPFVSAGTLLSRNGSAQPWEGAQGDDSFFIFRPPGSPPGGELLALYGSSNAASYWSVGLASSASGSVSGPWIRAPAGNPLQVNGQRMENPIVLEVAAPAAHHMQLQEPLLLAVYDQIGQESEGFGLTWSADGKGERVNSVGGIENLYALPPTMCSAVWAPGQSIAVPGGVRAPMGALVTGNNTVSVWFNRQGAFDSLWVAQFALGPAPPFSPPDGTPLTLRPCEAASPSQTFVNGSNGTLRLASAPAVCVDLNGCDTSVGLMDVWACHAPGDACGGAFPSNPAINQRFSINANGTISYTDASGFCLVAASASHAWVAAPVVLQPCLADAANQTWVVQDSGEGAFALAQQGQCINVG